MRPDLHGAAAIGLDGGQLVVARCVATVVDVVAEVDPAPTVDGATADVAIVEVRPSQEHCGLPVRQPDGLDAAVDDDQQLGTVVAPKGGQKAQIEKMEKQRGLVYAR